MNIPPGALTLISVLLLAAAGFAGAPLWAVLVLAALALVNAGIDLYRWRHATRDQS